MATFGIGAVPVSVSVFRPNVYFIYDISTKKNKQKKKHIRCIPTYNLNHPYGFQNLGPGYAFPKNMCFTVQKHIACKKKTINFTSA